MIILSIFIIFVFGLFAALFWDEFIRTSIIILILGWMIAIGIFPISYEITRVDMQEMEAEQTNILLNYKTLVLNMNKVAVVDAKSDKIIVDLANFKQSTNTSETFVKWIATANKFNIKLAGEKAKREVGFIGHLWYGWRFPINKNLKFIEIKI